MARSPHFGDDELPARYSSQQRYVVRVKRAADDLAAKGYITNNDRNALFMAAEDEPCRRGWSMGSPEIGGNRIDNPAMGYHASRPC